MTAHGIYRERGVEGLGDTALVQFDKDRFEVPEALYRALACQPAFELLPWKAELEGSE